MHGDFSEWSFDLQTNFSGILHQQGRVLLDADTNHHTLLVNRWQDETGRTAFGSRVLAVPAHEPNGFRVHRARAVGGDVRLALEEGQGWADGLFVHLRGTEERAAPYLSLPVGRSDATSPSPGDRDAVVLEVWREAVNGFQVPSRLIEPALGGPDTSERLFTAFRLALVRLEDGEDCIDVVSRIQDDLESQRGRLTATLEPTQTQNGPCPVTIGGGYTGFEHNLFRIEIAHVDDATPHFNWSAYNGGLVGRGEFEKVGSDVFCNLIANREAILRSGIETFYLEVLEPRPSRSQDDDALAEQWIVTAGAPATLTADSKLEMSTKRFGTLPLGRDVFFRLWNGIERVSEFASGLADLRDGIQLRFDLPAGANYVPGDYWTFSVRAGDVGHASDILLDDAPPEGVRRHRVALAELHWNEERDLAREQIIDCRKVFPPLTDLQGCCIHVAPGESLARALRRLRRAGGGCLCLLPGDHILTEPLDFSGSSNIRLEGFGLASRILTRDVFEGSATFVLNDVRNISFRSFAVLNLTETAVWSTTNAVELTIERMFVYSTYRHAIPHILTAGLEARHWRVDGNLFAGATVLSGHRLVQSQFRENICLGTRQGVDVSDLLDVRLEENLFLGIAEQDADQIDRDMTKLALLANDPGVRRAIYGDLRFFIDAKQTESPRYIALRSSSLLDVTFLHNHVRGGTGVSAEIVEGCDILRTDSGLPSSGARLDSCATFSSRETRSANVR